MFFKIKCWLNKASKKYPRMRHLLLQIANKAGVVPIGTEILLREQDLRRGSSVAFLAGKPRLLTRISPSVRRNLESLDQAISRGAK